MNWLLVAIALLVTAIMANAAVDHVPSMSPSWRLATCNADYVKALEQRIRELEGRQ